MHEKRVIWTSEMTQSLSIENINLLIVAAVNDCFIGFGVLIDSKNIR